MARKISIFAAIIALLLSTLACALPGVTTEQPLTQVPPTPTPTPTPVPGGEGGSSASLNVINSSGSPIFYLYISPSTSTGWGDDQLPTSTIAAGASYTFTDIAPGTYDLKAEDGGHNIIQTWMDVTINGPVTWDVTGTAGGTESGEAGTDTAMLHVVNNSGTPISYLYISPSTSSGWGDNQLGSNAIAVGGHHNFRGITPGSYNLKAEDSSHNVIQTRMDVALNAGRNTWTVNGSGGGTSTATLHVVNNSGTAIFYLYISPSSSSSWGDDQLGTSTVPAGGSHDFTGITPDTYDLKAEDSGHNVIASTFGIDLSGGTTWTVTSSGGGGGGTSTATLTVANNSGATIFYLYVAPSSDPSWGSDRLGSSTLAAGSTFTVTGLTPGVYDLKAENSAHNVMQAGSDINLAAGTNTWTVTSAGSGGGTASLTVVNNASVTICYLYISPSTSSGWGDDQLGSDVISFGGSSHTFTGITPGAYDLKAEDCSHNMLDSTFNVSLSGTYTWTVTSSGGGGMASIGVVNNTGVTICYLYISPSTSSSWGDDRLGTDVISAGGSYTFSGITPGNYDLKAEDCSHNVLKSVFNVNIAGPVYTWYVTP